MEEELNVVANKLAEKYQDKLRLYQPNTHMYPSVLDVLKITGMTTKDRIEVF